MQLDTYSFVVRIWREAPESGDNARAWRGSVDSVSNGERLYFDDVDEVSAFIRRQIGLAETSAVPRQAGEIE